MTRAMKNLHFAVSHLSRRFNATPVCGFSFKHSTRAGSNLHHSRSASTCAFLKDTDEVLLSNGSKVRVDTLGYRPNVAVVLFNKHGKVLSCRRYFRDRSERGTERSNWNENWQFPQGGIDEGEDPLSAAVRELAEETSITDVEIVAESKEWLTYDFDASTKAKLGASMDRYRGQKQKYILMRFTGADADIVLDVPGHQKEFDAFEWVPIESVAGRVVGFKQDVYAKVAKEFAPIIEKEISAVVSSPPNK